MTNYREILRLRSLGINHSRIAESMGIARQTVIATLQRASAQEVDWQSAESMSDRELAVKLFPAEKVSRAIKCRTMNTSAGKWQNPARLSNCFGLSIVTNAENPEEFHIN